MDPFCRACNDQGCWQCGTLLQQRLRQITREADADLCDLSGFLRSVEWDVPLSPAEHEMVSRAIRWGIGRERARRLVDNAPAETCDELARFGMLEYR